jgi:hypothetical protein
MSPMSLSIEFGTSDFIGADGTRWPAPAGGTIDDPALPCAVALRMSIEEGAPVLDEITYRRRPKGPPITGATISAAPCSKMIEIVMEGQPRAQYLRTKAEFLDELGVERQDGDDIDALIAKALQEPVPDEIAMAWKLVVAQDPAKLRRGIRSHRIRRRKRNDDQFLAKVAKVYTDAFAEGQPPTREVARRLDPNWNPKYNENPKTAQRWVKMAREKGLLGETQERRKGGVLLKRPSAE